MCLAPGQLTQACRAAQPCCAHARPLQIGADIVKRALPYSLKLIANNAGDNGSVVMQVSCSFRPCRPTVFFHKLVPPHLVHTPA